MRCRLAALAVLAAGCSPDPGRLGDLLEEGTGDATGGDSQGTETDDDGLPIPPLQEIERLPPRGVDILFVVDNSRTMGAVQGRLAEALRAIAPVLESTTHDFRLALTTTDHGNPWCTGASPELGASSVRSCREHLDDFVVPDAGPSEPAVDASVLACLDVCPLETIDVLPTSTALDEVPRARPWIERSAGVLNVAAGGPLSDVLACAVPPGIDGCAWEQPLESMYAALQRMREPSEDEYGFVRDDAALVVMLVSDEADCSYAPGGESIFLPEGERTFWTNPEEPVPTAAVCWNAGVTCSGGDEQAWGNCAAQNKDTAGNQTTGDAAVLHPLQRYSDVLADVVSAKSAYLPDSAVQFAVLGGIPVDAPPVYPKVGDVVQFGVGPGCEANSVSAVPTARMLALAFEPPSGVVGHLDSVCAADYAAALQPITDVLTTQVGPRCYPACVADLDPDTDGLQPVCTVTEELGTPQGRVTQGVPACGGSPDAPVVPPEAGACWYARTDRAGITASAADDVAVPCMDAGLNLEIEIVRDPASPPPGGTVVYAGCVAGDCL